MQVARMIDSAFRSGEKNGKTWTIKKIELDDGSTATGFDDVAEGDEVTITKNDYGQQYKAVKKAPLPMNDDALALIIRQQGEILRKLDQLIGVADTPEPDFSELD